MALPAGSVLNNRYRIVKTLGEGGMGRVYRGWDLNLRQPCAIKENLDLSGDSISQFEHEARILAGLHHPNLPRVTDHFQIPGQGQYLVMDYIEGEDLQTMLDKHVSQAGDTGLPESTVLPWILQICDALTYLHNHQPPVIHRDVKPANIKINLEGKAILVDFGIAKLFTVGAKTTKGARAATPGYAPPEQFGLGTTDERSDIYAIGATTYTLLTGQVPPPAMDVVSGNTPAPLPIDQVNPLISPHVSIAVEKAMQINRALRFASAADLARALHAPIPVGDIASQPVAKLPSYSAPSAPANVVVPAIHRPQTAQAPAKSKRTTLWIALGVVVILLAIGGIFFLTQGGPHVTPAPTEPPAAQVIPPTKLPTRQPEPTKLPTLRPEPTKAPEEPVAGRGICATGKTYRLSIWHPWNDPYTDSLISISQEYSRKNPCVTVDFTYYEDLEARLLTANAAHTGPDLISWSNDHIGHMATDNVILDLDRFGVNQNFLTATFEPAAVRGITLNGKIYGLPQTQEAIALVYNRKMDLQAFLPTDPLNFGALYEKARQFQAERGFPLICNQAFGARDAYHAAPVFFGFGVPQYVDETGRGFLNVPQAIQAAEWIKQFRSVSFPESGYEICEQEFIKGQVGMWWTGPWAVARLLENGMEAGIVPMGRPFVGIRALFMTTAGVNRGNQEAILDLMKYLTTAEAGIKLAKSNKILPAQSEAVRSPMVRNDPIIAGFAESARLGVPMGNHIYSSTQWGPVGDAIFDIWHGALAPQPAMQRAQKQLEELVAQIKNR